MCGYQLLGILTFTIHYGELPADEDRLMCVTLDNPSPMQSVVSKSLSPSAS